jgi:putative transposase
LSWVRRGERKRVPYENPQRRRLNVLAATVQQAEQRALFWLPLRRHCTADDLLTSLERLADPDHPTIVVLDNAGFHHARLVRDALAHLRQCRVYLYYLPPYSPELNDIERLFRTIKHHHLPQRTYATFDALDDAVDQAFRHYVQARSDKPAQHPGLAA